MAALFQVFLESTKASVIHLIELGSNRISLGSAGWGRLRKFTFVDAAQRTVRLEWYPYPQ